MTSILFGFNTAFIICLANTAIKSRNLLDNNTKKHNLLTLVKRSTRKVLIIYFDTK